MVLFIHIVKTIYKDDQNKNNFINKTYRGKKIFPCSLNVNQGKILNLFSFGYVFSAESHCLPGNDNVVVTHINNWQ